MREIKFRALDKRTNEFIYFKLNNNTYEITGYLQDIDIPKELSEWQQFTGLKDKKGIEIYEEDIAKFDDLIGVITWDYSGFYFKVGVKCYEMWRDIEVIGNIYQNHGLVEK